MGLILSICYVAAATRKRNPVPYPDLAELNRGIKLWNLPCDLLVWGFLLVKLIHSGFAGYGLGIMVVFMFGIPYGITRLFMLWSAVPVCKEALRHAVRDRRISLAAANWHIFLHFLPIADIISGVSVARALRPTPLTTGEE